MDIYDKALMVCFTAHEGIIRKYTNEPYAEHPIRVAETVSLVDTNIVAIISSLLHDTVEDTNVTFPFIEYHFGKPYRQLVYEVTNPSIYHKHLPRKERKEMDKNHLKNASDRGKTIKLADMKDNLPSILKYDPEFAEKYFAEKWEQWEVLKGGNKNLYEEVREILKLLK